MREKELAIQMTTAAKEYAKYGAVIDIETNQFGEGHLNLEAFKAECNKLGYDVVPVEKTSLDIFQVKGKLAIVKKK